MRKFHSVLVLSEKQNGLAEDLHCKAVWMTMLAQPKSLYLSFVKVKKLNSAVKKRMMLSCFFKVLL